MVAGRCVHIRALLLTPKFLFSLIGVNFLLLKGTEYSNADKKGRNFHNFTLESVVFPSDLKIVGPPPKPT